ncbi:PEP-CTERM sorting domain-containing protein [Verrucomicrobiaceae bacterium 5K15]|uniref:PEP-CTERM sorting domain-containing protein n=1 Tax=Oceaniferula flava TaxID=2800421 RepID=A0AAE2SEK2_9BACT|nr:PEP-CTERM sorting domain-containing protein [Oceaniferula flavus]MBK1856433.1 PEP-CTERM sorting domain-containing protein [Oceaniferula flavus]MBM1137740.1 PEP-CTERM sorting domain-containing protein [Oceaniferula flavus]
MKIITPFASIGLAVLSLSSVSHAAITVINSDFSAQSLGDNSWAATTVDTIDGWTFTGSTSGSVNILADGEPAVTSNSGKAAGDQYVVFNEGGSATGGTLYQTITGLTIGQQYEVSFEVIEMFNGNNNVARINGDFNSLGSSIGSGVGTDLTIGDGGTVSTFTFTATDAEGVLTFTDASDGTSGIDTGLDNISITAVPEPGSAALLGLGGLALLLRRRK